MGFMDDQKEYLYSPMGTGQQPFGYANRACISKAELGNANDMMKPALKRKIVWHDPRLPGTGTRATWVFSVAHGVGFLRDIFQRQHVTFSRDYRQMIDMLISCSRPVAIGIPTGGTLEQMQRQGIGAKVEALGGPAYYGASEPGGAGGNESIGWYNDAPHPAAAKVFVNWYLSRAFQQYYALAVKDNSRRRGTKEGDPAHAMKPGVKYFVWSNEAATRKIHALQRQIRRWGVLH